ncbi:hypothetical protein GN956_G5599 [Arapaima gigas]
MKHQTLSLCSSLDTFSRKKIPLSCCISLFYAVIFLQDTTLRQHGRRLVDVYELNVHTAMAGILHLVSLNHWHCIKIQLHFSLEAQWTEATTEDFH